MVGILMAWVLVASSPSVPDSTGTPAEAIEPGDRLGAPESAEATPTAFEPARGDPRLRFSPFALSFHTPQPSHGLVLGGSPLRRVELSRAETSLKGLHLGATTAAFLGAVSVSYDLWDDRKNLWLVGGAAALGALYGGTLGYEKGSFRTEVRFTEE